MKYLQKTFTVAVGGSDNYDNVFGKKCFYCRQYIEKMCLSKYGRTDVSEDWEEGAHSECEKKAL